MIDESAAPTYAKSETALDNPTTDAGTTSQTYRVQWVWVLIETLWLAIKILFGVFIGGVFLLSQDPFKSMLGGAGGYILIGAIIFAFVLCILLLWYNLSWARAFSITSDENGLTLHEDKRATTIGWNEVAAFRGYRVVGTHKEVINLPGTLGNRDGLRQVIEEKAAQSITKHLIARYQQEGKVELGVIEITNKGLLLKGQFVSWESIYAIVVDDNNDVQIIEEPGPKIRRVAALPEIPNYYALGAFVELLRPQAFGVPLIEQPGNEQAVAARITKLHQAGTQKGGINVNGATYVNIIYARDVIQDESDRSIRVIGSIVDGSALISGDDNTTGGTIPRSPGRSAMGSKKPRTPRTPRKATGDDRSVKVSDSQQSGVAIISGDNSTVRGITATLISERNVGEAHQRALEDLMGQLKALIEEAKEKEPQKAAAVQAQADALIQQAGAKEPNTALIQITADGLKKAAENIASVTPTVLDIATRIVTLILGFVGL